MYLVLKHPVQFRYGICRPCMFRAEVPVICAVSAGPDLVAPWLEIAFLPAMPCYCTDRATLITT
ncbi:hypothetical protein LHK_02376 [Laribacter hongkongensis HLHK9]|uniref:Uncharacterized protein n=1 Tax=Laribacter hongkongensis (strain HLHK9) TaxID=557598 RepID=C1DB20_LARHH|nr:hypothetical protein LHK_02376 [Laribacter hongkongensis HLHK9]